MDPREFSPLPAEFSRLPDEGFEESLAAARAPNAIPKRTSFDVEDDLPPETAALPPEFGQTSGPQTDTKVKNRKRVKWLYAIAVLIIAAIANGNIGGSKAPVTPVVPVETGDEGDPVITIEEAYVEFAASSNYSFVEYCYSVDPVETDWPISVSARVVDGFMAEARPENGPDVWNGPKDLQSGAIETTQLDAKGGMAIVLTAQFTRDGEEKTVSVSAPVTQRQWKEGPIVTIERAEYRWAEGSSPAVIEYEITFDPNDVDGKIELYASAEDKDNYVKTADPYTVSAEKQKLSGTVPADGLKTDGKITFEISVEYTDNKTTVYRPCAEADVTIPEAPQKEEQKTYPLGSGNIVLTVYNNSFDSDAMNDPDFPWMKILLHETIAESDWVDMTMPEAYDPNEDWDVAGFVLHYGSEFDYGYSSETGEPFIKVLEDNILTREDIELVPPSGDGNRYVNVHVMWLPLGNYDFKHRLELALNDDTDDVEIYEADTPFASEGYTYLAVYGEPEWEGHTFTGWYDEEGNKVEYLSYYDFVDLLPDAKSNEDRDWEHPKTIRLTAGWE